LCWCAAEAKYSGERSFVCSGKVGIHSLEYYISDCG
jgi:hypothetical protein